MGRYNSLGTFSHPESGCCSFSRDLYFKSAVMLTANVGFLAIPGVILSNLNGSNLTSASQVVIFPSSSQIASSFSVVTSIGSIVIGLLLVRHNRTKQREDPAGAVSGQLHQPYAPK